MYTNNFQETYTQKMLKTEFDKTNQGIIYLTTISKGKTKASIR